MDHIYILLQTDRDIWPVVPQWQGFALWLRVWLLSLDCELSPWNTIDEYES
jgi:hypothetical protein